MTSRRFLPAPLTAALVLIGCGPSLPTSAPVIPAPHNGVLYEVPDGGGFIEVVRKKPASAREPMDKELTFYFLKDQTTPMSPAPTAGSFRVDAKKKVDLKPDGDGLATPPGAPLFPAGDPDGVLSYTLDGESKFVPIRGR